MAEKAISGNGGNGRNDPSRNVLDLVDAAIQRQDDLRTSESRHVREVADLRAGHQSELRVAEAARIDAIRQVDVEAVQRAAEVQATQQATLAAQVEASASAMREQVAAAASAATIALAAALEPVQKDIADLRRAQYEAQGEKGQRVETRQVSASSGLWAGVAVAAGSSLIALVVSVIIALS